MLAFVHPRQVMPPPNFGSQFPHSTLHLKTPPYRHRSARRDLLPWVIDAVLEHIDKEAEQYGEEAEGETSD